MEEERLRQAVWENDNAWDGRFYYAVKSTGVFCRPSCKSRPPKPENLLFFETAKQALAAGFRPCKRCRSDLPVYAPEEELCQRARAILEHRYLPDGDWEGALGDLGISRRHLAVLFQRYWGETPLRYVRRLRLAEAKRRLLETEESVTEIAYALGFESLSAFYRHFRAESGVAPGIYRKSQTIQRREVPST